MNVLSFLFSFVVVLCYLRLAPPKPILVEMESVLVWSSSLGMWYLIFLIFGFHFYFLLWGIPISVIWLGIFRIIQAVNKLLIKHEPYF